MSDMDKRLDNIEQQLEVVISHQAPEPSSQVFRESGVDLREIFTMLWLGRWLVVLTALSFVLAGVVYAYSLPNIYRAEVLLTPVKAISGGLTDLAGGLGGLASLAGVNVGGEDKTDLTLGILQSKRFLNQFARSRDIVVPLFAAVGWGNEGVILDSDMYDQDRGEWLREQKGLRGRAPGTNEIYERFLEILSVSQNKKTGFITVSIDFYSPLLAKEWLDALVHDLNEFVRERDVVRARESVEYLVIAADKTSITEMKEMFYGMIEEHTKVAMYAEVSEEYALETIDRAVVPDISENPKRFVLVVLFLVAGILVGVCIAVLLGRVRGRGGKNS